MEVPRSMTSIHSSAQAASDVRMRSARQAYVLLYIGMVALPVLSGADKFLHQMGDWEMYLAPILSGQLPVTTSTFMKLVGLLELVIGAAVAWRPQVGAYLLAVWLWVTGLNLLLIPAYFDLVFRDFFLSLGAIALGRLSGEFKFAEPPVTN